MPPTETWAAIGCGRDLRHHPHKTVRRIIEQGAKIAAGEQLQLRAPRERNFDTVADLVAETVGKTSGRISAKRLLPAARAAGYEGSPRNFRRLVAEATTAWP